MEEKILALAQSISGASAQEKDLLRSLCISEQSCLAGILKEDIQPEDCGEAFPCAVAFAAAADLCVTRGSGNGPASFTAGQITIRGNSCRERVQEAEELRQMSRRLLMPYLTPYEMRFCGVQG